MAISCEKQTVEVERLVGLASFQIPVRAEAPVPGAGRESVEVLMEDAFASVSGAEDRYSARRCTAWGTREASGRSPPGRILSRARTSRARNQA